MTTFYLWLDTHPLVSVAGILVSLFVILDLHITRTP